MKRIIALALAAAFVLGSFAIAQAVEIQVKGEFKFAWMYVDNGNFYDHSWDQQSEDQFHARQRTRIQVDFVASENLQGIFIAEIGEMQWGQPGSGKSRGAALGADAVNIETKRMVLQFNIPDTELLFSVGVQGLATPGIIAGSPILDDDVAAVLAQYAFNDMVTVGAFWSRLYDLDGNNITSPSSPRFDEFDVFGILAPIKGDGWMIHPYFIFAAIGADVFPAEGDSTPGLLSPAHYALLTYAPGSAQYANILAEQSYVYAWWVGSTFELTMFDPITFMAEGVYGSVEAEASAADRKGFYLAAELDYALDFMTIGVMGWYASGEDESWTNGSEQLPMVSENWNPTTFGWDGGNLLSAGGVIGASAGNNNNPAGKWGLALLLKDITFVEDLTHQVRVLYARGTNAPQSRRIIGAVDPVGNLILGYKGTPTNVPFGYYTLPGATIIPGIELTTEDYMVEVNFDHEYKLYENLALILELGMVHVQYGDDTWVHDDTSTGWKAAWGLKYKF